MRRMNGKPKEPSTETAGPATPSDTSSDVDLPAGGDDDGDILDADQLAAFEKIMGEIGAREENGQTDPETEIPDDSDLTDEELAKLDDVIEAIERQDDPVPEASEGSPLPPSVEAVDEEGLDEEQQRAFESIMAQIEGAGSGGSDVAEAAAATPDLPTDPPPGNPVSAEPEEAIPAGEKKGGNEAVGGSFVPSGEAGSAPSNIDASASTPEASDGGIEDISDDIEDILKEIASEGQGRQPADGAGFGPSLDATCEDIIEFAIAGEDDAPAPGDVGPDPSTTSRAASAPPRPTDHPQKDRSVQSGAQLRAVRRTRSAVIASAAVLLVLVAAGYAYWVRPFHSGPTVTEPEPGGGVSSQRTAASTDPAVPQPPAVEPVMAEKSRLKTLMQNLDRLRGELIQKQTEIEKLSAYYQAGIDAEIEGVIDMVRQREGGRVPFEEAMADPRIGLGLEAIQRRDAYVKKLKTPADTLTWNSEELLYLLRKSELMALMIDKTSDADLDAFLRQAEEVMAAHGRSLAQLNIDTVTVASISTEAIWQDIEKRITATPPEPESRPTGDKTDNASIWKDICAGDFSRKQNLTALSPEAARCLAAWKGRDLFLNAVTSLSEEAARHLAEWNGDWLGLNGLRELSPESAAHLSRWKGKNLSLNGLTRLSPRVAAILSEWQGDQIELVNVQHMAHWENPKTRLFLSESLIRGRDGER